MAVVLLYQHFDLSKSSTCSSYYCNSSSLLLLLFVLRFVITAPCLNCITTWYIFKMYAGVSEITHCCCCVYSCCNTDWHTWNPLFLAGFVIQTQYFKYVEVTAVFLLRTREMGHMRMEMRRYCLFLFFWTVQYYCSKGNQFTSAVNAARRPGSDWDTCWPGGNSFCLAGCQRVWKLGEIAEAFYNFQKVSAGLTDSLFILHEQWSWYWWLHR